MLVLAGIFFWAWEGAGLRDTLKPEPSAAVSEEMDLREAQITEAQAELDETKQALIDREQRTAANEQDISAREKAVADKEAELDTREAQIAANEDILDPQVADLTQLLDICTEMDPKDAARRLTLLYGENPEEVLCILKQGKDEWTAEVLANVTADIAAIWMQGLITGETPPLPTPTPTPSPTPTPAP